MQAKAVAVSGLFHSYGATPVLHDIAMTVGAGESLALLGPSGCGKTTLLRCIAGLEHPERGTIRIGDDDALGPSQWMPPEQRRVGMVFQDWALFPHLNVAKNIAYGVRGERSAERVTNALELVGLSDLAHRMPDTLSGGQQQRVALARALAPEPSVLLLDEPFSNLDTSMRIDVRAEVDRLLRDLGITSIFVTHDQEEAFVVGDQVAVMRDGTIVQIGDPRQIYTRPAERWVAQFVGAGSFLRSTAVSGMSHGPIGSFALDGPTDGDVDVLLRPEQLALRDGEIGVVEQVEFYGHDAMVRVAIDGQSVQVRSEPGTPVRPGDAVGVAFVGRVARAFGRD